MYIKDETVEKFLSEMKAQVPDEESKAFSVLKFNLRLSKSGIVNKEVRDKALATSKILKDILYRDIRGPFKVTENGAVIPDGSSIKSLINE